MKKYYRKGEKTRFYLILILIVLLITSVGYALFTENLEINGTVSGNATFKVYFIDAWAEDSTKGTATINIAQGADTVTYTANLSYPGDRVLIGAKIKNESSVAVKLNDFKPTSIANNSDIKLDYVTLNTNTEILQPNEVCDYEFVIYWDENSENQTPSNVLFDIQLDYEQYTNTIISPNSLQTLHEHVNFCKNIESTGTQYIDTGLNAKEHPNIIVEIEGNYTNINSSSNQYIFGSTFHEDWNTNNTFVLMGCINSSKFIAQNGIKEKEKELAIADTQKHTFVLDTISNIGRVDQFTQSLDTTGIRDVDYNYVLFAQNSHGVVKNNALFKMYYCKIIENNSIILNLIPCLDDENVPCMYDSVSKQYFYNNGTGTFRYE